MKHNKFRTLSLAITVAVLSMGLARAQDPLSSWNDGPAKQAIVEFVKATTDPGQPAFVPPEERIATFDQDGTLWVEHPMYSQVMYCLDRVPELVKAKPELARSSRSSTVLNCSTATARRWRNCTMPDLEKIARGDAHRHVGGGVQGRGEEVAREAPRTRAGNGLIPS